MSEQLATQTDREIALWSGAREEGAIPRIARDFFTDRTAVAGAMLILAFVVFALFSPWVAPHNPHEIDLANSQRPPAWAAGGSVDNLLGTDQLGRDSLSRIIFGSRVSLIVGFLAVSGSALSGSFLGLASGYLGGSWGEAIMRLVDIQLGLPFIVLAIVIVSVLGPSLANVILIFAILDYPVFARLVRSEVLSLKEREFILATRAVGASTYRILLRHMVPNLLNIVLITATLEIALLILYESALGFLGLSVPPSMPSWGNMLADGRNFLTTSWWIATFPGIAILLLVLGVNFVGDWLSRMLDPRRRRQ